MRGSITFSGLTRSTTVPGVSVQINNDDDVGNLTFSQNSCPSGDKVSRNVSSSITIYGCEEGLATVRVYKAGSKMLLRVYAVNVRSEPSISFSDVPDSMNPTDSDSFTVNASNLTTGQQYTVSVSAGNNSIGFSKSGTTCDTTDDKALSGSGSSRSVTFDLFACRTPGATITATLSKGSATGTVVATENVRVTVTAATSSPGTPRNLALTSGDRQILASWTAPADKGNPVLSGYSVQHRQGTSGTWTTVAVTATSYIISGLTNGQIYQVQVASTNSDGTSDYTTASQATPAASLRIPGIPGSLSLSAGDRQITASWSAPMDRGNPTLNGYRIQYRQAGTSTWFQWSHSGTGRTNTITGLTNGQSYQVRVAASNTAGTSSYTSPKSATPMEADRVPGVPQNLTLTPGDRQIGTSWDAPTDLGNPTLNGYRIQYRQAGTSTWFQWSHSGTGRTNTITGLTNGQSYQVRVAASNTAGTSSYTSPKSATPMEADRVPGVPQNLTLTPGDRQIGASWDAPTDQGNPALNGYLIQYRQAGTSTWFQWSHSGTGRTNTITGLTNGQSYQVRVAASNTAGTSSYTSPESATPVEPDRPPGVPRNLTLTAGNGQIRVSWDAPTDLGNPPLSGYLIQYRRSGTSTWFQWNHSGTGPTNTIRHLTNGRTYQVRVAASNTAGNSSYTPPRSARVKDLPGPLRDFEVFPGDGTIYIGWNHPINLGDPEYTGFTLQYQQAGGSWTTDSSDIAIGTTRYLIPDLTNGTSYRVRVAAKSNDGLGPWSTSEWLAPLSGPRPPSAPQNMNAYGAPDSEIVVNWGQPVDRGNPQSLAFRIEYRKGNTGDWTLWRTVWFASLLTRITGLENQVNYQVRVAGTTWYYDKATDSVVTLGAWAVDTDAMPDPIRAPNEVWPVSATAGDRQITVNWGLPRDPGRPSVTDYDVRYRVGETGSWRYWTHNGNHRTATITGLRNGTEYWIQIKAKNGQPGEYFAGDVMATPTSP